MYNTSFIKKILLAATVVLLYSCDKDFNAIGENLIGDDHFGLESEKYDVVAFNQEVTSVQSNILATTALGIYNNPVFGETTANYVTQVALATYAPTIGETPVIESAVLSVPYFSHITANNTDGSHTYALDSIYGPPDGKLKLSVYESGYQMRSSYINNGSELPQFYYTAQNSVFQGAIGSNPRLNNDTSKPAQNDQFFFSSEEYKLVTKDDAGKETTTYTAPEMRLNLDKDIFQEKILDAPSKLAAADVFQEYFRGLYFKVEKADGSATSNMALMDFSKGKITITYKAKTAITTDDPNTTEEKTLVINFVNPTSSGGTANLLQDAKESAYADAISSSNVNKKEGDQRLYIKGGQGSAAVIKLFNQTDLISYDSSGSIVNGPNGVPDQLDEIRNNVATKNWKVNEANLVFTIDADKMAKVKVEDEPRRIYLYDLTNNVPLVDYFSDQTSSLVTGDTKGAKYIFGGLINRGDDKRGKTYKFRITNYYRNLIKDKTAKNVDLGLVVTESIGISTFNFLENRIVLYPPKTNEYFSQVPKASVMNPLGTILYGTNIPFSDTQNSDYSKRLRLEVYYTKPN